MTIQDRLNEIIKLLYSGNKRAFANAVGISPTVVENIVGKRQGNPSFEVIQKIISSNANINTEWLIMGYGEMFKTEKTTVKTYDNVKPISQACESQVAYGKKGEDDTSSKQPILYNFQSDYFNVNKQVIPLYELEASAGLNLLFGNQSNQVPVDYISVPNAPKCDGAMFVRGDSMYPIMKSGDIICYKHISDLQNNLRFGEIYLLYINDGDDEYLTVKYVQTSERGDEYVKLVSQNKYHAPKDEHLSHILGAAIVKLSIRYNTIS